MALCVDFAIILIDLGIMNERPQEKIVWIKYVRVLCLIMDV